jgi:co-chaperonin GroES (HSP10)
MKPINDNIQIEYVKESVTSASGILIPDAEQIIRVVAIADSVTTVKPGDHIEVAKNAIVDAGIAMFVKEKDVIAIRGNA